MHLSIVFTCLTQDVNDLTDDVLMILIGPLDNLYYSLVVGLTSLQLTLRDNDIVNNRRVGCYQEGYILFNAQLTNDRVVGSLHNLDNHCLFDMLIAARHERYFYMVAIHSRHRVTFGHKHRCTTIIRHKRVTSVSFSVEDTFLYLSLQV